MLLECSKNDFEKYMDLAYELALDLSKSGYPTYRDGIKTKAMFAERLLKAFDRDDEQMLLFVHEGAVQGLLHHYWIPEDHYLQTNAFCIKEATEQALSEFLSYVGERFKGYDAFLGFPAENQKAVDYLSGRGFECIEDDINNTACLDRCGHMPESSEIIQITRENYDSFRVLHDQIEGDMYWNSDRICEDLDIVSDGGTIADNGKCSDIQIVTHRCRLGNVCFRRDTLLAGLGSFVHLQQAGYALIGIGHSDKGCLHGMLQFHCLVNQYRR